MIVIARFSFPHEAHIARASLEAAEIRSEIRDEHTVNMQWLYSNAVGGVRLLVEDSNVEAAMEILQADFSAALQDAYEDEPKDICPECGSDQLSPHTKGKKPAFVAFLLLGFPLFFYKHGYICDKCGAFSEKLRP